MHVDFKDEDLGARRGILWTGYRVYQGKGQEIDINISANTQLISAGGLSPYRSFLFSATLNSLAPFAVLGAYALHVAKYATVN